MLERAAADTAKSAKTGVTILASPNPSRVCLGTNIVLPGTMSKLC